MRHQVTMLILGASLSLTSALSMGEELVIPIGEQTVAKVEMPRKAMTMSTVETKWGEANVKHPARGTPPITRWEYSDFVVYFEGEHVIHSVYKHKPKAQFQTPTD